MREIEWDGTGFPPVGCKCEIYWGVKGYMWRECVVFAHKNCDLGRTNVLVDTALGWSFATKESEFRPIKTPEKIAAEERDKAITEMVSVMQLLDKEWSRKVCATLYDAGYRKP